nr:hypothetical protein [Enterovibrio nigricans]
MKKVALVTGGSAGIGLAVVEGFIAEGTWYTAWIFNKARKDSG